MCTRPAASKGTQITMVLSHLKVPGILNWQNLEKATKKGRWGKPDFHGMMDGSRRGNKTLFRLQLVNRNCISHERKTSSAGIVLIDISESDRKTYAGHESLYTMAVRKKPWNTKQKKMEGKRNFSLRRSRSHGSWHGVSPGDWISSVWHLARGFIGAENAICLSGAKGFLPLRLLLIL